MIENNKPETKFNMSLAILERINNMLSDIAIFSAEHQFDRWFDSLQTLRREFSYLLNEEEKKENKKKEDEIIPLYLEYKFSKDKTSINNHIPLFNSKLDDYDSRLKDLLYQKGLLIIHKEDIHRAVTRR